MLALAAGLAALLALLGSTLAVVDHVKSDTGALSLYLLGALQGFLFAILSAALLRTSATPPVAKEATAAGSPAYCCCGCFRSSLPRLRRAAS